MPATTGVLGIKDGAGVARNMRVLDESGAGTGPFQTVLYRLLGDPEGANWSYAAAASGIVNTTTAVTIKSAAASGIRNWITSLQVQAEALGAATEFAIRDGAGGTVLWRIKIGTGGMDARTFTFDPPLVGSAATLLEVVTLTASVTGAVYCNAQGYVAP